MQIKSTLKNLPWPKGVIYADVFTSKTGTSQTTYFKVEFAVFAGMIMSSYLSGFHKIRGNRFSYN